MMEYLFRAWDKITNKMADVEVINFDTQTVKISFPCENDRHPETWYRKFDEVVLMQYTGSLDKNEVKIFEGDIVKVERAGYDTCEVEWINGGLPLHTLPRCTSRGILSIAYNTCEVIGNIYDNKELLNE